MYKNLISFISKIILFWSFLLLAANSLGQEYQNERVHYSPSNFTTVYSVEVLNDSMYAFVQNAIDSSNLQRYLRILATDKNLNEIWSLDIKDANNVDVLGNHAKTTLVYNDTLFFHYTTNLQKTSNLLKINSLNGNVIDSTFHYIHLDTNAATQTSYPIILNIDSSINIFTNNFYTSVTSHSLIRYDIDFNFISQFNFNDPLYPGVSSGLIGYSSNAYNDSLLLGGMRLYNLYVQTDTHPYTKVTRGWIKMYDTAGNELHNWLDTNLMSTQPKGIVPLKNGNIIAVNNYGVYSEAGNGILYGMKIFCLDQNLNLLWEKKIDTSFLMPAPSKESNQMILTKDSSLVIVGRDVKGETTDHPTPEGWFTQTLGRLTKIDQEGNVLWDRFHYNLPYPEQPHGHDQYLLDIEQTNDSGFIAVGVITKGTDCQAGIIPCQFGWVLKTDKYGCIVPGCHLEPEEPQDTTTPYKPTTPILLLYPNPANDVVHVYFRSSAFTDQGSIKIIDMQGNTVKDFTVFKNDMTYSVPVHDLAQGTYIIQYMTPDHTFKAKKLVITR